MSKYLLLKQIDLNSINYSLKLNSNFIKSLSSADNPSVCSHRANQLDRVQFVNAYDELGFEESKYIQFLEVSFNLYSL